MNLYYGTFQALKDVSLTMDEHAVTALIGPSGCGKSTFIKTLNRMNDLIPGVRVEGTILYRGRDIFDKDLDVTLLRKRIGMVFQKPNPFPMTVYDNVAYGPRLHGVRGKKELDDIVEEALRGAAIWDEVKDRLRKSALGLSGGQQQRLCIARALAVKPDVLLMDEPTSALDPISTSKIEELCAQLKKDYTIVIVTHNMQQAVRDGKPLLDAKRQAHGRLHHREVRIMRSEFDKELHTMHKELMGMGASCERAIALAASSITNGRPELTDEVRAAEEDIDRAERSIEALCMRLLLRQQPVATDLRNISAALKMISDLERVGDYAMDIVELSPYLSAAQLSGKAHLAEMALAAVDMVKQSVQAFVDGDVQLAARVKEQDDKVDELFDKVKEEAVELIRTGSLEAHAALDLGMAAKYFERIGDHAVNVAEWVTYAHTGEKK